MKIYDKLRYKLHFEKVTRKKSIDGTLDTRRGASLFLLLKMAFMLVLTFDLKLIFLNMH
jgi:hypothetical protein